MRFDVAYATSLSADGVPVLIDALPSLPRGVQCPLARHMLRRWSPDRERSIRTGNWSASRASDGVREHEARCARWWGRVWNARRSVPQIRRIEGVKGVHAA